MDWDTDPASAGSSSRRGHRADRDGPRRRGRRALRRRVLARPPTRSCTCRPPTAARCSTRASTRPPPRPRQGEGRDQHRRSRSRACSDASARAFSLTFNENGLALIEMHLATARGAASSSTDGLRAARAEFEPGPAALHRSVLRYNRAQLLARRWARPRRAREYGAADRGRPATTRSTASSGRRSSAGSAATDAARTTTTTRSASSPPYPEPYYNRAELAARARRPRRRPRRLLAASSSSTRCSRRARQSRVRRCSSSASWTPPARCRRRPGLAPDQPHLHCVRGDGAPGRRARPSSRRGVRDRTRGRPTLAAAWSQPSRCCVRADETDAAIEYLTRALQAAGPDATILANRALAYEHAGADDALADLAAALEHEVYHERAELEGRLAGLRRAEPARCGRLSRVCGRAPPRARVCAGRRCWTGVDGARSL